MRDSLPEQVTVRPLVDGTAYVLPRRPLGKLRYAGVFLIVFGAVFACGPGVAALRPLLDGSWSLASAAIDLAVAVAFLVAGGALALVGLVVVAGRAAVEVRRDELVAVERVGPLRFRRRRKFAGLRRIRVDHGAAEIDRQAGEGTLASVLARMASMKAEIDGAKPLMLALGYPGSWLVPLARRLADEVEAARPDRLMRDDDEVRVEVVEHGLEAPVTDEIPDGRPAARPPASRVALRENPDGITLTIPPAGILRGSRGLFVFGVVWCALMAVFSGFTVVRPAVTGRWVGVFWIFAAGGALFWAIGVAILVGAINMGRRYAIIDVVDDVLLVNRKNLFGIRSHQLARDELETVTVGPSGMAVNDVPVLELRIRPKVGAPLGFFAGRDEDELRWIAWAIRDQLALEPRRSHHLSNGLRRAGTGGSLGAQVGR